MTFFRWWYASCFIVSGGVFALGNLSAIDWSLFRFVSPIAICKRHVLCGQKLGFGMLKHCLFDVHTFWPSNVWHGHYVFENIFFQCKLKIFNVIFSFFQCTLKIFNVIFSKFFNFVSRVRLTLKNLMIGTSKRSI